MDNLEMMPPKKEEKQERKMVRHIPKLSNVQRGIISLGVVAGAVYAIKTKRSFLGILGFMWLGSIAGGGIGYVFKKEGK